MAATQSESDRFAKFLDSMKDDLKNYTYYVVVAKEDDIRDEVTEKIRTELEDNFPNVKNNISFIQIGPPADYPVTIRVNGNNVEETQVITEKVAEIVTSTQKIKNLPIYLGEAGYVPLEQVAKISFDVESGLIIRRDLKPTITVQANIKSGTANDTAQRIFDVTEDLRKNLLSGCKIELGGDLEESDSSNDS